MSDALSITLETSAGEVLRGAALRAAVRRLAERLEGAPFAPVGVLADNGVQPTLLELATRAVGRPWMPLPTFFSDAQLRRLLERCPPGDVFSDAPERLAALFPGARVHAAEPGELTRFERRDAARPLPGVDVLTCTSGSTGEPSIVLLEHEALARVARSLAEVTGMTAADRHLAVLPQAVLLESVGGLYRALTAQATLITAPLAEVGVAGSSGFDAGALDTTVRRTRANSLILMPEQLAAWTALLEDTATRAPEGLRFVGVGGAPGSGRVLERARALGLPVSEGYGLSEAGSVVCLDAGRNAPPGSVGPPLPHVELRIDEGLQLHVRGATCLGRLDEPSPLDAQGWLATGDLVDSDDQGRLWIRGRKDLGFATSYGRNLSPEWIERALLDLPGVRQAVVFGDGLPGPVALLAPGPSGWSDAARRALPDALKRLRDGFPDYARLRGLIVLPEAIRVDSGLWAGTGRPRRAALWARYGDELTLSLSMTPSKTPSPLS